MVVEAEGKKGWRKATAAAMVAEEEAYNFQCDVGCVVTD